MTDAPMSDSDNGAGAAPSALETSTALRINCLGLAISAMPSGRFLEPNEIVRLASVFEAWVTRGVVPARTPRQPPPPPPPPPSRF